MLGKLILFIMLLCVAASADSIIMNGYNVSFEMGQPHEITAQRSESNRIGDRTSRIEMIDINSSKGTVSMIIGASNMTTQESFANASDVGGWPNAPVPIEVDNKTGWYAFDYNQGAPNYFVMYYIQAPASADYYSIPSGNETTVFNMIVSTMPLYDTADFLRSLHTEPLNETALIFDPCLKNQKFHI